ncbi:hypothetical protein ACFL1Q_00240 [Patescibacteria group bacterium]
MSKLPRGKNYQGQALLLVLLSLAVILTVVLYVLSRSITDIYTTSRSEESVRAFSAAEAGIERALIAGSTVGDLENASFNASVSDVAFGGKYFNFPLPLPSGGSAVLFFVSHDEDGGLSCDDGSCFTGGKLEICWGNPGTSASSETTPAIEASIYYVSSPGDYSTVKVARAAIDPNDSRRGSNSFEAPDNGSCSIGDENYEFKETLNFSNLKIHPSSYGNENGLQLVKVNIFYSTDTEHKVGFNVDLGGNSPLPSQGVRIESVGTSGEANRKIEVFQGWGEVPQVFDSVVFSGTGIVK